MTTSLRVRATLALKRMLYSRRGEPYPIKGHCLRYVPGTRPVRLRYVDSPNSVTRYDALQLQLLAESINPGDIVVDIGAHYGQYCILMAALSGKSGQVIAFEPDPYARAVLDRNLGLNPQIKRPIVEACAVSEASGEAVLYTRGGNAQSSLAKSAVEFADTGSAESVAVKTVSLDEYLHSRNIGAIQWLKIDTEGAEIRILKGAPEVLASDARIVCELHPYAWEEFGNTFQELKDAVRRSGRIMRYLDSQEEIGDRVEYGTVLLEASRRR